MSTRYTMNMRLGSRSEANLILDHLSPDMVVSGPYSSRQAHMLQFTNVCQRGIVRMMIRLHRRQIQPLSMEIYNMETFQ